MASVTFITLYDSVSMGVRIMSAYLRAGGHTAHIIYFKASSGVELDTPQKAPIGYEYFHGHELRGHLYASWTPKEVELLIERLRQQDPQIIALSCRSLFDGLAPSLLDELKRAFPDKILLAGGMGPSLNPRCYAPHADFVAFGEGEEIVRQMADARDAGLPLEETPNLLYLKDGTFVRNPVRRPEEDFDRYPFPPFDDPSICLIHQEAIHDQDPAVLDDHHYPVLAGRGCVGTCSYCSSGTWRDLYRRCGYRIHPRRLRTVDGVMQELRQIRARGFKRIEFVDSYLTGPRDVLLQLFQAYGREIRLPFFANLHTVQMTRFPALLDAACRAGLDTTVIGVQHGSEAFRRRFFLRRVPNRILLEAARLCEERNVYVGYDLIVGSPFENEETLNESLAFVAKLPMRRAQLNPLRFTVFPQSPVIGILKEHHLTEHVDPLRWHRNGLLYVLRTLVDDDIFERVRSDPLLRDRPDLLRESVQEAGEIADQIGRTRKVTRRDQPPLEGVAKAYRRQVLKLGGRSLLVWGTGSYFQQIRHVFEGARIAAFLDNDAARHGTFLDGIPVRGPSFAKGCDLPVFICAGAGGEIAEQMCRDYPDKGWVPFSIL